MSRAMLRSRGFCGTIIGHVIDCNCIAGKCVKDATKLLETKILSTDGNMG